MLVAPAGLPSQPVLHALVCVFITVLVSQCVVVYLAVAIRRRRASTGLQSVDEPRVRLGRSLTRCSVFVSPGSKTCVLSPQ